MMESKTKHLLNRYCEAYGIKVTKGTGADLLLPFLMMIAQNDRYNARIRPLKVKGDAKYVRNLWGAKYREFERILTYAYDLDGLDYIGEMTDGFEEFINNEMTLLRAEIVNKLPVDDFITRCHLADALLCNILVQSTQYVWGATYGRESPLLNSICNLSARFCDKYNPLPDGSVIKGMDVIDGRINKLCRRMLDFIDMKLI